MLIRIPLGIELPSLWYSGRVEMSVVCESLCQNRINNQYCTSIGVAPNGDV